MNAIRTFIALELPETVKNKLEELSVQIKKNRLQGINWVSPQNIHLTLKFLGDTSPDLLEKIKTNIFSSAGSYSAIPIVISKLGAFPNLHHPRVIWIGLQAPQVLSDLQYKIEESLIPLGFPKETRPFTPHLTLGRVNQNISVQDLTHLISYLSPLQDIELGSGELKTIHFFRSDLKPTGAIYTSLYHINLK